MKIFIITEGGTNKGFGHIVRCTSLYEAFLEKGMKPVFIVNGDESVRGLLENKDHKIFNWLEEYEVLAGLIKNADIAIIDSYLAGSDFYKKISDITKLSAYIDDDNRLNYPGGIVINGSISAKKLNYPEKDNIIYLIGPQYIMLRKVFWNLPEKKIRKKLRSVMITPGGDDIRNITPEILKLINENYLDIIKKVIIGKGFRNMDDIRLNADIKTELIYYPDAEGMKKVMMESDIAISAGGQTLYELAISGVPVIAIGIADNQLNNLKSWQENGFIEYAGWWQDENLFAGLLKGIEKLEDIDTRKKKSKIGKNFIDSKGAVRIAEYILDKLKI